MEIFLSRNISQEPIVKINNWLKEAIELNVPLPHAMCLSTSDLRGKPSSRMVLLKSLSDEGLIFSLSLNFSCASQSLIPLIFYQINSVFLPPS